MATYTSPKADFNCRSSPSTNGIRSIRGYIIILLTKVPLVPLPLDIARAIWHLRQADYEAARWQVMGLHYRAGTRHRIISSRPWRFTSRMWYEYVRCRQVFLYPHMQLEAYVDSHWYASVDIVDGRHVLVAPTAGGQSLAECLIHEIVGVESSYDTSPYHARRRGATTDGEAWAILEMIRAFIGKIIRALQLCGVAIAPTVMSPGYHLHSGWTEQMLIEYIHKISLVGCDRRLS